MVLKDPRIKLLLKIGKFSIYKVDGDYIRGHIEPNFTNYAQYYRFPKLIKNKYEFWVDQEGLPGELPFYLTHLLKEFEAMKKGMSYNDALDLADRHERVARQESEIYKKAPKNYPELIKKIQLKKILTFDGIDFWIVNDELVRDLLKTDFTEGGNSSVYKGFQPPNTVWISSSINKKEIPFTAIHEYVEQFLMLRGMSYNKAHIVALKFEWEARHKDERLQERNL